MFAIALCAAALGIAAQAAPAAPTAPGKQGELQGFEPPKEVALSGVLAFVGDEPAIKTESGTVLIEMPRFYYYAYIDGLKAGMAVKATGLLIQAPAGDKSAQSRLAATELSINGKTYVIVRAGAEAFGPGRGAPDRDDRGAGGPPAPQPQGTSRPQGR